MIHWIVSSDVSNVVDRWLIATLTTVVSRIDMITPRTTTMATLISARSMRFTSGVSGAAAVAVAVSGGMAGQCSGQPEVLPPVRWYRGAYDRHGNPGARPGAPSSPGRRAQPRAHPRRRGGRLRARRPRGDDGRDRELRRCGRRHGVPALRGQGAPDR